MVNSGACTIYSDAWPKSMLHLLTTFPILQRCMSHHITHRALTMVANPVQFGPGSDPIERNSKTDPDSSEDKIKKWFFLKLNQINN